MSTEHFADRLAAQIERKQSQVVVGLDPRLDLMPPELVAEAGCDSGEAAAAVLRFNRAVIDAVCDAAVAVKCQIAFYERLGCAGLEAYAQTLEYARDRGLIVIGDVKRGDIGSTAQAYAEAHIPPPEATGLGGAPDFRCDAVTVNPLFGSDGMGPFIERAAAAGCGVFALVKTSNPSSAQIQDLDCGGVPLYERIGALVEGWGEPHRGRCGYSLLGAVVGATFPEVIARLRGLMPHTVFLVPGFGAQGGGAGDVAAAFDSAGMGALVSSSRGIIYAYRRPPYDEEYGPAKWLEAVRVAAERMREEVWTATRP